MSRLSGQKLKVLHIMRLLLENTDEDHPMTLQQIAEGLARQGVEVRDRKSLYDDIETLRAFGLDIAGQKIGRSYGYFIASREFELPELKLLVDAVQGSRFITHKKTTQLIGKLEKLLSVHQARALQRQVYALNRIKTMNESIYYNVDSIHQAISQGRQISFKYTEWVICWDKGPVRRQYRRGGQRYQVSPWALTWDDENYYLVCFDASEGKIKHFRVDKMALIEITDKPRDGGAVFKNFDIALYSKKMFGMFSGQEEQVKLLVDNGLIGVMVDRFGSGLFISRCDEDRFYMTVKVHVSPQFLSWLFGFGDRVKVQSPKWVADRLTGQARELLDIYESGEEDV